MSQYAQTVWDEYHSFKGHVDIIHNICNNTPEVGEWVVNKSVPVGIYGLTKKKFVFCFRKWKFVAFNEKYWSGSLLHLYQRQE